MRRGHTHKPDGETVLTFNTSQQCAEMLLSSLRLNRPEFLRHMEITPHKDFDHLVLAICAMMVLLLVGFAVLSIILTWKLRRVKTNLLVK